MRVKIWGARGSVPTPIRPEEVREKIVSAILNISKVESGTFREELIAAVLDDQMVIAPTHTHTGLLRLQQERRQIIETYLDGLSPLGSMTAGGNTPCIEIRSDDDLFIIDAGSGIRELGRELMQGVWGQGQGVIHLFFSHPHWDHIQGFPFFRPAFIPGNKIFIYGVHDLEAALRRQQEPLSFPVSLDYMQAEITFIHLEPGEPLEFGDLRLHTIRNHHPGDAYSFRFEKGDKVFVYASDAAYPSGADLRPYLDFFAGANVLIFDAQFTQRESDEKEDWGHSSSFMGVEMAQAARVENLLLFHYDPTYTDQDLEKILADTLKFQQNQYPGQKPVNVMIAQEGHMFDLTPTQSAQLKQVPGGKAAILKATGIFDEQVVAELKQQLAELVENGWPTQLIIDMSEVELMQVAGLRALVRFRKETRGAHLALAGPSINVQQLIELAGYLDFFAIYPSVHSALNALRVRETLNLPGQTLKNRYYIEDKIGEGILGTVFRATDTRLNQPVAIKILSASFSEEAIEQFLDQGRQIVELDHPNIVNVYDCDEEHGLSFMVEELVESKLLRDLIDEGGGQPVPFDLALSIAQDIALGLEYAHNHGVIHGDLKPKNVLLAGRVKISDFGLGRLESGKSLLNFDVPLALVTAHYLAPEQVLGHPIDARTDLYALGVMMYELFTGVRPFEGSDEEVLEHHRRSIPQSPRALNPNLSCSLEHLILKLLDKDPTKRYATARRVRSILAALVSPVSREPLARHSRPALVGREKPLRRLAELWAETQQGRGQLVFITGEPGVGKTRLAQALVQQVEQTTILIGHCCRSKKYSAYQPFIDALKSYLSCAPADHDPVKQVLAEICRFVSEIPQLIPAAATADAQSPPAEITGVAGIIARAAQKQPWLFILDDLQWADQSSLQLWHYLERHCAQMSLMMVGLHNEDKAGRNDDPAQNQCLVQLLADLPRYVTFHSISLERLPQGKVKEMLENIWQQPVPLDLVAAIYRRTQGNPLFVDEVARGLLEEGVVARRDARRRLASVVESDLPKNIHEAVHRRIDRLSKETQTLLYQAAILGPTFRFADLHEMSDLSEWDALENLDIALERQFIRETPHEGVLRFKHPEIRQVFYQNLGGLKRRLMHREAGEALERRYAAETETIAPALAGHFHQAQESEKRLKYSLQAATQAEARYAGPIALFWYTQALEALDHLERNDKTEQQQFELLLAREQIYSRQGQRKAQAADLVTLQTLAQTSGDPARQSAVHNRRAAYERAASRFVQATTEAEAGLQTARQAGNPVLEGESLEQMAQIAINRGDFKAAREHLQAAQNIFAKAECQHGQARCLNALGTVHRQLYDYAQAEDYYQRALTINRAVSHWPGQAVCLSNLGAWYQETGDYAGAKTLGQQALEINRLIGYRRGEAICLHRLALIYKALGHYQTAQTYLQQAMTIRRQIEDNQGEAEDLRAVGFIHLDNGEYAAAREHIGQALEIFQSLKIRAFEGDTWLVLGLALEGLNDLVKARHAYQQAQTIHTQAGKEAGVIEARAGLARCLLAKGEVGQAQTEIDVCLTWLKPHATLGIHDPIRLYLTVYRVLQAAGNTEAAAEVLQTGLALLRRHADNIDDPELRASFLENVPENKELLGLNKSHYSTDIQ
ncbi:MAG: tetratricopeptide repeat protein [Anaerolineae bacterium]|nr:tetratricopeptide repeat protein [Anaerolineae bacterium]